MKKRTLWMAIVGVGLWVACANDDISDHEKKSNQEPDTECGEDEWCSSETLCSSENDYLCCFWEGEFMAPGSPSVGWYGGVSFANDLTKAESLLGGVCDWTRAIDVSYEVTYYPNNDNTMEVQTDLVCFYDMNDTSEDGRAWSLEASESTLTIAQEGEDYLLNGLDFFPGIDAEVYRYDTSQSQCTAMGGQSVTLILAEPHGPLEITFIYHF